MWKMSLRALEAGEQAEAGFRDGRAAFPVLIKIGGGGYDGVGSEKGQVSQMVQCRGCLIWSCLARLYMAVWVERAPRVG